MFSYSLLFTVYHVCICMCQYESTYLHFTCDCKVLREIQLDINLRLRSLEVCDGWWIGPKMVAGKWRPECGKDEAEL